MDSQKKIKLLMILLFLFLATLFSIESNAAIGNGNVLDTVTAQYAAAAKSWGAAITAKASWLFWVLTTISMVWTFGMMALRKADIGEFYGEFIKFIVFTGFFWWLLSNGPKMATDLINSMLTLGSNASGTGYAASPSGIVDMGFGIFYAVLDKSTIWQPLDSAIGAVISGIVLVILTLVAVNMLLLLISAWILAYAGVFMLGFGGSRWTSDMAIAYFKTVLNVGLQLLTMVLLVGIGKSFITQYYSNMSGDMNLKELAVMLVVSIALLVLTNKIPPLMGNMAMGGGTGALGNGFGAGAALATGGALGAAAAMGGTAIKNGAANIAGGTQALMAAYQNASSEAGSGSGVPAFLSNNTSSSSQGGPSTQTQASPLAKAMGIAANTGANLARGVSQVAQNKGAQIKESTQNRIDQTIGGQVATAIRGDKPSFDNNSLEGAKSDNGSAFNSAAI